MKIFKSIGSPAEVHFSEAKKNNGVVRPVVSIVQNCDQAVPSIPIEQYFEDYTNGCPIELIVMHVLKTHSEGMLSAKDIHSISELVQDPEYIKGHVMPCLINTKANKDMLDDIPHREFLDLTITLRLLFEESSVLITNALLEGCDLNVDELFDAAFDHLSADAGDFMQVSEYVYTESNAYHFYGASALLDFDRLEKFTEILGENFFICPSSVHEIILIPNIPKDGDDQVAACKRIIRDVNGTLNRSDYLSDNLYQYDSASKTVKIV